MKGGMRISAKAVDLLYASRDNLKLPAQKDLLARAIKIKMADISSKTIQERHVKAAERMCAVTS